MTRRTPLPFGIRNAGGPAVPNDGAPVSVWATDVPARRGTNHRRSNWRVDGAPGGRTERRVRARCGVGKRESTTAPVTSYVLVVGVRVGCTRFELHLATDAPVSVSSAGRERIGGLAPTAKVRTVAKPTCFSCRLGSGVVTAAHDDAGPMADLLAYLPPRGAPPQSTTRK